MQTFPIGSYFPTHARTLFASSATPLDIHPTTEFTMWLITTDLEQAKNVSVCSQDYDEKYATGLIHRFRLLDGDRIPYYEGVSDDASGERAFDPLDDFGEGYAGCASLEYLENGKWSPL